MSIAVTAYPMMPTRPCSFCLSLQGGSVLADFDVDALGIVFLRRISFDGYGCCRVEESATRMKSDDSRLLLNAVASDQLDGVAVEEALQRYFRENKDLLWTAALAEHELL